MSILGLGKQKLPFIYFDQYIPDVDWDKLHADVSLGISQSTWNKRFVSSGVHDDFKSYEITPYLKEIEFQNMHLNEYEREIYGKLRTYEEKIKYINALKYIPHPFWVLFIRNNKRIESSGVFNKAIGSECEWTENKNHFQSLVQLIEKMPFKEIGRVMLFMTEANNKTLPHFDSKIQNDRPNDDFIWFTTKRNTKNIFIMDSETKEKIYPNLGNKFIWFNEMDYHGTDSVDHFSFSIRIDGVFDQKIKNEVLN